MLYPLTFEPILKEKIWGGDSFYKKFGIELPSASIGESWNIAAHPNGTNVVANGPFKGKALDKLISIYGGNLLGTQFEGVGKKFPLLIKLIDANDMLSVQVHPDDDYATLYEDEGIGKTEMWYIIDAQPGSSIVYGTREGTTREKFKEAIKKGDVEKYLNTVEVEAGDVIYMPAGTIHAIGAGILICEIQQNSDTTYRVYDWNRLDVNGQPRKLHIDKALDVIDFEIDHNRVKLDGITIDENGAKRTYYIATEHFAIEKLELMGEIKEEADGSKFYTLSVIEGNGYMEYGGGYIQFQSGQSILIPASLGEYKVKGKSVLIKAYIPDIDSDIVEPLLSRGHSRKELASSIVGYEDEEAGTFISDSKSP